MIRSLTFAETIIRSEPKLTLTEIEKYKMWVLYEIGMYTRLKYTIYDVYEICQYTKLSFTVIGWSYGIEVYEMSPPPTQI